VSAVAQIITGLGRVVAAGVADAVVDGVMPVVIVVCPLFRPNHGNEA
jgi:hypothetical protein